MTRQAPKRTAVTVHHIVGRWQLNAAIVASTRSTVACTVSVSTTVSWWRRRRPEGVSARGKLETMVAGRDEPHMITFCSQQWSLFRSSPCPSAMAAASDSNIALGTTRKDSMWSVGTARMRPTPAVYWRQWPYIARATYWTWCGSSMPACRMPAFSAAGTGTFASSCARGSRCGCEGARLRRRALVACGCWPCWRGPSPCRHARAPRILAAAAAISVASPLLYSILYRSLLHVVGVSGQQKMPMKRTYINEHKYNR